DWSSDVCSSDLTAEDPVADVQDHVDSEPKEQDHRGGGKPTNRCPSLTALEFRTGKPSARLGVGERRDQPHREAQVHQAEEPLKHRPSFRCPSVPLGGPSDTKVQQV